MAANATIYKMALNIANMDDHYYGEHNLTLAQHPSENDLRMMIRVIAFALNANEALCFGEGIATDDEADLWQRELNGDISVWIDLGQPDEKRIRKACGKSDKVIIYTYAQGPALAWWQGAEKNLKRFKNLSVVFLRLEGESQTLVKRSMNLQANISDGECQIMDDEHTLSIIGEVWQ